ncbi:MAG TPA: patatin-like phospholipase family protein [Candidatus Saccharimonadales bacterium]|nr:patatin-like phospholipase family protein [Candidatus Saccharimonadales bacterium]
MKFSLCCAPASGANFISQLVILQHLCQIHYKPDLCLGSSGGNLALYIAAAADWQWADIERISKELKSSFFAMKWSFLNPISHLLGFFNGTAFTDGKGLSDFLKTYFTDESIVKYQIITGTYNKDLQKIRLFVNTSKESSLIKDDYFDYDLTQSMHPCYMDGDYDLIATAGLASASIPGLVPPKLIDGHYYSDGASSINSPMTILHSAMLKALTRDDELHITYVNCKDLSHAKILPNHNLFDTWKQAVNDLIKSQTLIDRLAAFQLLQNQGGSSDTKKMSFPCNHENLLMIKQLENKYKYTLLEIYPTQSADIDITNFTSEDIERNMKMLYESCHCHFWWID